MTPTREPDTTGPQASTPVAIVLPADPDAYVPGARSTSNGFTGQGATEGQATRPFHLLAWGGRVAPGFRIKAIAICERLEIDPDYLMAVMAFDTGRTFDPAVINASSGAVGLIQFLPATVQELGSTPEQMRAMSALEQLDMMEAYLFRFRGRLHSLEDVFMAVLYPNAIGQDSDYILFGNLDVLYAQNRGLDLNADGVITKAEASEKVRGSLAEGLGVENRG